MESVGTSTETSSIVSLISRDGIHEPLLTNTTTSTDTTVISSIDGHGNASLVLYSPVILTPDDNLEFTVTTGTGGSNDYIFCVEEEIR